MKTTVEWFLEYAWTFLGLPYKWGGDDPKEAGAGGTKRNEVDGLDCSGFVIECLQAAGKYPLGIDSNAQGLWSNPAWTLKFVTDPAAGCLVFFGKPSAVTHVAICLTHDLMLEAGGGGSKTLTVDDAKAHNAFIRLSGIRRRSDIVGFINPFKE